MVIRSINSISVIYDSFSHFKLKTMKKHSFNKWCVISNIFVRKEHLTQKGLSKIKVLSKKMNMNNEKNIPVGKAKIEKDEDIVRNYL